MFLKNVYRLFVCLMFYYNTIYQFYVPFHLKKKSYVIHMFRNFTYIPISLRMFPYLRRTLSCVARPSKIVIPPSMGAKFDVKGASRFYWAANNNFRPVSILNWTVPRIVTFPMSSIISRVLLERVVSTPEPSVGRRGRLRPSTLLFWRASDLVRPVPRCGVWTGPPHQWTKGQGYHDVDKLHHLPKIHMPRLTQKFPQ